MPVDLLPFAFALTLVANAALIALAIRALRRGSADRRSPTEWHPPVVAAQHANVPPVPALPGAAPPDAEPPPSAAPSVETSPEPRQAFDDLPLVAAEPLDETQPQPRPVVGADPAPTPRQSRRSPTDPDPSPASRRRRRKFSLPPLDDDHEKVNRSIESFLAGGDAPAAPSAASDDASDDASGASAPTRRSRSAGSATPTAPRAATTIAVVALGGLGGLSGPSSKPAASDEGPLDDAVAMLERTLRSAARASDEVHVDGHGRFRIVLPATGELAARAYLRRIRATVEPQLEASDRPLHLVVATATALDVTIRTASAAANRRLDAALAARGSGSTMVEASGEGDSDESAPRAAAD